MKRYLVGIDDTDNAESHGTGRLARQMAERLQASGLAQPEGITRHQLLVSPQIPYTSHNSSACITLWSEMSAPEALVSACRDYLSEESAPGSDAGLCLARWENADKALVDFGETAKSSVLSIDLAYRTVKETSILLEGVTGDGMGVIGALAAVGLRAGGKDGRFLWLPGLRTLSGSYTPLELHRVAAIDRVTTLDGVTIPDQSVVQIGEWVRPVLHEQLAILYVEEAGEHVWRVISKENIQRLSG
jgi:hypothetical protein